jgi:hypothetical protein
VRAAALLYLTANPYGWLVVAALLVGVAGLMQLSLLRLTGWLLLHQQMLQLSFSSCVGAEAAGYDSWQVMAWIKRRRDCSGCVEMCMYTGCCVAYDWRCNVMLCIYITLFIFSLQAGCFDCGGLSGVVSLAQSAYEQWVWWEVSSMQSALLDYMLQLCATVGPRAMVYHASSSSGMPLGGGCC